MHSWQDVEYVLSWFGGKVSQARKAYRAKIAKALVDEVGLPMAKAARRLGVTTAAISRVLQKVHNRN